MTKLSEAQLATLRRLRDGDEAWQTGRLQTMFWMRKPGDRTPAMQIAKLNEQCLIENYSTDPNVAKFRISAAGCARIGEPAGASATRSYPVELTPALREVLGMMVFQCAPIAHGFKAAGFDIRSKAEDEQAFVLHWLVGIVLEHGDEWRKVAGSELQAIIAKAKANIAGQKEQQVACQRPEGS